MPAAMDSFLTTTQEKEILDNFEFFRAWQKTEKFSLRPLGAS